jgi:hypothetical protein
LNRPGMTEDNNIDAIGYIAVLNRILLREVELADGENVHSMPEG